MLVQKLVEFGGFFGWALIAWVLILGILLQTVVTVVLCIWRIRYDNARRQRQVSSAWLTGGMQILNAQVVRPRIILGDTRDAVVLELKGAIESWTFGYNDFRKKDKLANEYVKAIVDALKVGYWQHLKGAYVRVQVKSGGVHAISHLIEDRWFTNADFFAKSFDTNSK